MRRGGGGAGERAREEDEGAERLRWRSRGEEG